MPIPTFSFTTAHATVQQSPSFVSLARALVGCEPRDQLTYIAVRERGNFAILSLVFGVFVGVIYAFAILTSQELEPCSYSDDFQA